LVVQLAFINYASFFWTIGNYGHEAAAFLNLVNSINKLWISFGQATAGNYGSKEAAFLNWAISVKKMGHYYRATGNNNGNGSETAATFFNYWWCNWHL
jgi:hypothetical protein